MTAPIIEVQHLRTDFGDVCIHKDVSFTINAREVFAIVGGSGSGKTTLLRNILMLQEPTSGSIKILGKEITQSSEAEILAIQRNVGVMFQQGALFSSMTVLENVAFPMTLHTSLPKDMINELALMKIAFVGLPDEAALKYPIELSGGMIKRAAVARAIAMDPQLLFLDEPTSGLDPQAASALDELVLELKKSLGLTIILVTHDLDSLWRVADRVVFLGEKRALQVGTVKELAASDQPLIQAYFSGPRARGAKEAHEQDGV